MLFYLLQKYTNIQHAIINDLNGRLISAYRVIRDFPENLINVLSEFDERYRKLNTEEKRKEFFLYYRDIFNEQTLEPIDEAAMLIFLNRTCFNGLYRENSKGKFNVPFGRYSNPTICDRDTIMADSRILQRVEILNGDYSNATTQINGYTLVYFDPPYRPLNATSNFNSYIREPFDDNEQIRLGNHMADLDLRGAHILLSNSDCRGANPSDMFFDNIYGRFHIERVCAKRNINANASNRGILSELLIRNYEDCQGDIEMFHIRQNTTPENALAF